MNDEMNGGDERLVSGDFVDVVKVGTKFLKGNTFLGPYKLPNLGLPRNLFTLLFSQ